MFDTKPLIDHLTAEPTVIEVSEKHKPLVVHAHNSRITEAPERKLEQPRFLTAQPIFNDVRAFIAYVKSFSDSDSRIFYTQKGDFTAVLDYHIPHAKTRHGDHIALLHLERSPEWLVWEESNEEQLAQADFAEFLEDNALDILSPEANAMLAIASNLQANSTSQFRSAINQQNGTIQLKFDEQVDGRVRDSQEDIPNSFTVGLRPFYGSERYPVECRLRYRVPGGALKLHYKALHLQSITDAALDGIVKRIADETRIEPAHGAIDVASLRRGI